MFEIAELGRKLSKTEYKEIVPDLRTELLEVQRQLQDADFSVLILLNGVEGAGKGAALNLLHEWMDARYMEAHAVGEALPSQRSYPDFWRFWMALPPKGRIGVYVGNWYTEPIIDAAFGRIDDATFHMQLQRINDFERALVDDGTLVLKFWFHLSKEGQRRRLDKLAREKTTSWRVTKRDRKYYKKYDAFRRASERALRETSTGDARWTVIEGEDPRYRNVTMARHVLARIRTHLQSRVDIKERPPVVEPKTNPVTILDQLDLTQTISGRAYAEELERWQGRLAQAARNAYARGVGATLVFEGWDASGKGGAIRRLIPALDARQFRIIPIAAPTEEERAHHYLWRFWRHLPGPGRVTIYDRSWYGRVLVERVEGFAEEVEWRRAYKEINDFEEQLVEAGIVLVKYWLHISSEEQLRRFKEREQIAWKQHKITEEDYRNREKASLYEAAADEMIGRTSTEYAPWTLVEAESKHFGRIKVIRTFCKALEAAIERKS